MTLKSLAAFLLFLPVLAVAGPPQYTVWNLPNTDPLGNRIHYGGISNIGQVAGSDSNENVYLLDPVSGFQYLGTPNQPGIEFANTAAINDFGLVMVDIGIQSLGDQALVMGQVNIPGWLTLPNLPGTLTNATASALNDNGQVVGSSYTGTQNNIAQHAVLWFADTAYDLGVLPGGSSSFANAINEYGIAAGGSYASDGKQHGATFTGGTVTDLGILPGGSFAYAASINSSGVCVGFGANASGIGRALLFGSGPPQDLGGLPSTATFPSSDAVGIADDGTIIGYTNVGPGQNTNFHTWALSHGTMYDLTSQVGGTFQAFSVNAGGQILAEETFFPFNYVVLTPVPQTLSVTVTQRVDGGTVPNGTKVKLLNNDGTPLSPATSTTVVSGVATFSNPPSPSGSNTSYEVEVCPPTGAKGLPAFANNVSLGSTTVHLTNVTPNVYQALTTSTPVAFATCKIGSVSASTGTNGEVAIWLPDGTYSTTISMNPGAPCSSSLTLGASSSSKLVAGAGFAELNVRLTRIYLTVRLPNGTTLIPKTGSWSIGPVGLSYPVTGQAISPSFWLPNGNYTATLMNGPSAVSGSFNVGTFTPSGLRTLTAGAPSPATVDVTVNKGGLPVTGAAVTLDYQSGATVGPQNTLSGATAFTNQTANSLCTVAVQYVDSTGTVFTGSDSTTFTAGVNHVTIALSPASSAQSATVNIEVTNQNGDPLNGASVFLSYSGGATSATQATGVNGVTSFSSQETGVSVLINVSYTDPSNNVWTSSVSVTNGFTVGVNSETVAVTILATVTVNVFDGNGALPGTTVFIQYSDGTQSQALTTDVNGNVTFTLQPTGLAANVVGNDTNTGEMGSLVLPGGFSPGNNGPYAMGMG